MIKLSSLAEAIELGRTYSGSLGFVPSLGGLHQGHQKLIEQALVENDEVVVSLFLNPIQFDSKKDLESYPGTLEADLKFLKKLGVHKVWTPGVDEIYPKTKPQFIVQHQEYREILCAKARPGHLDGVLTIVLKLLLALKPNKAYFGEKDFLQLRLIEDMVHDFYLQTEIIEVPTHRTKEGVAYSTRNSKLSPEGYKKAVLFAELLRSVSDISGLEKELISHNIEIDYLEEHFKNRFAAVFIEGVRLIDHQELNQIGSL